MKEKVSKKRLLTSALYFVLFYVILLALVFVMIVLNDTSGWTSYFRTRFSDILLLCVCIFLLFAIIYYYLYFENKEFLGETKNVLLILTVILFSVVACYLIGKYVSIYARPVAMLAFTFVFLLSRRQAIILNFVFSFLMFVIDTYTNSYDAGNVVYFSLLLTFVCGTFGIFLVGGTKTRGGLMLTGIFVSIPTVIVLLLLKIPEIASIGWIDYVAAAGFGILGCILSSMFALAFLPLFERVFNRLTVFRLRELTSTNAPILVRLKKEAPGTFNHSLIVAHLSETCAVAIGENAELARAAGYYHDVGKLKQPDCFTENQSGYNVHDELSPELSADIIRSHAKDGYELLVAAHLPEDIADIAREHHGTLPIKYFYNKAVKLSGDDVDPKDFSYLGPTPRSKIAAIIMIADASEAASRAIADRSPESVERVVRGIIEERMDLDQFSDCNITMRELTTIKETLVEALSGVHHHRVKYPAIRFNRERKAVDEKKED